MSFIARRRIMFAVALIGVAAANAANAAPPKANPSNCKNTGSFERWLDDFRAEAAQAGVSQSTIRSALGGMTFAPNIIARDRGQKFFAQTFLDFSGKLATAARLQNGKRAVARHKVWFDKAEAQYGVPPEVLAAFWALESDFGVGMGDDPVLRSLATLAYDCRRPELFRPELLAALKIIERGDLQPEEMIGSWAGELGQTQFLPTHWLNHAQDADGDGRRDLMRDAADIILSSAAYVAHIGWRRGEPWLEEVRVPSQLPWDQADLAIRHQRGKWAGWGVTYVDGRPLPSDGMPASLLLPMGRFGPAFLAYHNFTKVYLEWNQSLNYATTAAFLATRIAGAPAMRRGSAQVASLSGEQVKSLQVMLARRGFDVGKADGTVGAGTRAAVKAMQQKYGLPADSYPTIELLEAMGGGGNVADDEIAEPRPPAPLPPPTTTASTRKRRTPPPPSSPFDSPFGSAW